MRLVVAFLVAWCWSFSGHGAEPKGKPTPAVTQDALNLREWAETNQLQFLRKEDEVRLTNQTARVQFKMGSSRAEINGVTIYLSFPIVPRQGDPWISRTDLDLVLRPILFPAKLR